MFAKHDRPCDPVEGSPYTHTAIPRLDRTAVRREVRQLLGYQEPSAAVEGQMLRGALRPLLPRWKSAASPI